MKPLDCFVRTKLSERLSFKINENKILKSRNVKYRLGWTQMDDNHDYH